MTPGTGYGRWYYARELPVGTTVVDVFGRQFTRAEHGWEREPGARHFASVRPDDRVMSLATTAGHRCSLCGSQAQVQRRGRLDLLACTDCWTRYGPE